MNTVYLCPNAGKSTAIARARELLPLLFENNLTVFTDPALIGAFGDHRLLPATSGIRYDLALVLGGDGTILRAAGTLVGTGTPILGVNLGHLGYLADAESDGLGDSLAKVLEGRYTVEYRAVLDARLSEPGKEDKFFRVFNDLTIHRSALSGTLSLRTYINGTYMDTFLSDGVIASTPSGSTAYNFSAGGPIVNPLAQNIIFTPICAHSVFSRSIVLMASDRLSFELDAAKASDPPILSVDGDVHIPLSADARIDVTLSELTFPLIRTGSRSFYEILRKKMFR